MDTEEAPVLEFDIVYTDDGFDVVPYPSDHPIECMLAERVTASDLSILAGKIRSCFGEPEVD